MVGSDHLACDIEELWKSSDVAISLGGDGSMLSAARSVGHHGIPILGINLGSLGFLTETTENQVEEALNLLEGNKFEIEERMVLQAVYSPDKNGNLFALNDIVFDHGDSTRLAKIDLYCNGEFVCPYNADGIVVSTPTGSTAYSLAAGGPVINPLMEALAVTPVAPHTLTLRTIIFPADSVLTIRVGSGHTKLRLAVDGRTMAVLKSGEEATVRKASHKLKLVKLGTRTFYEVLRTKLHWGVRPLLNM